MKEEGLGQLRLPLSNKLTCTPLSWINLKLDDGTIAHVNFNTHTVTATPKLNIETADPTLQRKLLLTVLTGN